jgi:hypothetical protein
MQVLSVWRSFPLGFAPDKIDSMKTRSCTREDNPTWAFFPIYLILPHFFCSFLILSFLSVITFILFCVNLFIFLYQFFLFLLLLLSVLFSFQSSSFVSFISMRFSRFLVLYFILSNSCGRSFSRISDSPIRSARAVIQEHVIVPPVLN